MRSEPKMNTFSSAPLPVTMRSVYWEVQFELKEANVEMILANKWINSFALEPGTSVAFYGRHICQQKLNQHVLVRLE